MTRLDIDIDIVGVRERTSQLDELAAGLLDLRPAFERIAGHMLARGRERFATRPGWPPLDPDTLERKAELGQPSTPLVATGRLLAALTRRGGRGQRLQIDRNRLAFGLLPNGAAYHGKFHQQGAGVPRRTILDFDSRDHAAAVQAVRDHLGL